MMRPKTVKAKSNNKPAKAVSRAKSRILLVEDDEFLSKILIEKLVIRGFDVVHVKDGAAALKAAGDKRLDAILLDILIPKKNGFEVLTELKRNSATKAIPVLMLTNLGKREDVDRALKLGAVEYLIKAHFAPSDMIDRLNKVLGKDR